MKSLSSSQQGFTLIEVLIAVMIFGVAVLAIVGASTSSRRAVLKSQHLFEATQLAQLKMTEMELKYQKEINSTGIPQSGTLDSGGFEAPFADYKWKAEFAETKVKLTGQIMSDFLTGLGVDRETADEQIGQQKVVLANLNRLIRKNYGEIKVTIEWDEFGHKQQLAVVTHVIPVKPRIEVTPTGDDT